MPCACEIIPCPVHRRTSIDRVIASTVEAYYPQEDWFRKAIEEATKPDPRGRELQ